MTGKPVARIRLIENGPIALINLDRLTLGDGSVRTTGARVSLCRCGASAIKPYCDGSHSGVGFASEAGASEGRDTVLVYEGEETTIHYNRMLCSHAGECTGKLGAVFDAARRPWIIPDRGDANDIRQVVAACPSGALRIAEDGAEPRHLENDACSLSVEPNGPYLVRNIAIEGVRWALGASRAKYALCRCGKSGNMPFCDGTHYDAKWRDE